MRIINWIVEYDAKSFKKKLKNPKKCSKIAKQSLFFPFFWKKSFLNQTLGISIPFLNQTTYVLRKSVVPTIFLKPRFFLKSRFICTIILMSRTFNLSLGIIYLLIFRFFINKIVEKEKASTLKACQKQWLQFQFEKTKGA